MKDGKSIKVNSQLQHQNGHLPPFKLANLFDPEASWDKVFLKLCSLLNSVTSSEMKSLLVQVIACSAVVNFRLCITHERIEIVFHDRSVYCYKDRVEK